MAVCGFVGWFGSFDWWVDLVNGNLIIWTPVDFEGSNIILNKPDSMTDEECGSLPVKFDFNNLGANITSCWELTDEELALIVETKKLYLTVYAHGMPPVAMYV